MERHAIAGLLAFWLILPAAAGARGEEAATHGGEAGDETSAANDAVAEKDEAPGDDAPAFRLHADRDVGLRLSPNAGLRIRPPAPVFSPQTADYAGRPRAQGPLRALAVSLTPFSVDGERESFKAQEFRDFSEHLAVGLDLFTRGARDQLRLTGRHLTLEDRDADLEWRRFGIAKTRVRYNRIPHNFAFDAPSLYSGIGSGVLTIDDAARQTLAGSTSAADAAARARELVAAAPPTDVALARERLDLKLDVTAFDPLAVEVRVNHESRDGARPWSGTFGYFNFVEIPWAVDYDTLNARVQAEYAAGSLLVRGSYAHSSFDNNVDAQLFDNPWRITDSSLPRAILSTFETGPATGRIDLYPDNEMDELTLTLVKSRLAGRGTLLATVATTRMEQDDLLLPYTTNTAIVPGAAGSPPFDATDPANLPAARADTRFDSRLVHLRWTSKPRDSLSLQVHFRDHDVDNEAARISIPGFANEDHTWRRFFPAGGGFTNLPITASTTSYGVEVGLHAKRGNKLTLSWEREDVEREFREVESSEEDRWKLQVDAKPTPWMDLRASYLTSEKEAESYVFDQFYTNQGIDFIPALPFLLKYDQASRDRDRLQLLVNLYPHEAWVVSGQVIVGSDDFPESRFGVLGDDHEIYSLDLSYAPDDRLSFFGAYSLERYDIDLRGREWRPFGPGDPFRTETGFDSASNWTAQSRDDVETITVGLEARLIPDRLRLDVSFSWSESDGRILYDSPIGAVDANPFAPADFSEVDDVTFYNLNPELEVTLGDRLSLVFAYLKEKYEIFDLNNTGFQLVPVTAAGDFNGAIFMGTLPRNFDVEILALKLELTF